MKKLTTEEQAERYQKQLAWRRDYYEKHKEERKAYQRKRYHEMREALKQVRAK